MSGQSTEDKRETLRLKHDISTTLPSSKLQDTLQKTEEKEFKSQKMGKRIAKYCHANMILLLKHEHMVAMDVLPWLYHGIPCYTMV